MLKVKVVTGFVPLQVNHVSKTQYKVFGDALVAAVGPENIRVFNDPSLDSCRFFHYRDLPHADDRLYPERYASPAGMSASSIIQHNRTSWALRAAELDPDVDVWVWIDYGVMKQGEFTGLPVRGESIRKFLNAVAQGSIDDIPFPGIWPELQVADNEANWRFCGSTHIWPKKYLNGIHYVYVSELDQFISRTGKLPYDMTIWAAVERTGGLPFRQYLANHDDTQFTNFTPMPSRTPLCELALKYGTDKCVPADYTKVYYDLFKNRASAVDKVLEIGICAKRDIPNHRTGASLYMWSEFFPNATILGLDIDPASMVNDPSNRIYSLLCDQSSKQHLHDIGLFNGPFELIVDDGSHNPVHQLVSLQTLLPFLAPDGVYVIEDIGNWMYPSTRPNDFIAQLPHGFVGTPYGELPHQLVVIRRG